MTVNPKKQCCKMHCHTYVLISGNCNVIKSTVKWQKLYETLEDDIDSVILKLTIAKPFLKKS